jgi:hypothetical protein
MFICHSVECVFRGVDGLWELEFDIGSEEFNAKSENISLILVMLGNYFYYFRSDVGIADEVLDIFG